MSAVGLGNREDLVEEAFVVDLVYRLLEEKLVDLGLNRLTLLVVEVVRCEWRGESERGRMRREREGYPAADDLENKGVVGDSAPSALEMKKSGAQR